MTRALSALCIVASFAIGALGAADPPRDGDLELIEIAASPCDVVIRSAGGMIPTGVQGLRSGGEAPPDAPPHAFNASPRARIQDGCLYVIGTSGDDVIVLRLQAWASENLEIDFGNDGQPEFAFERSAFDCIVVNARDGDDQIWIDEWNGVFTDTELTTLRGGCGEDTLIGGSGGETFEGGPDDDLNFLGAGDDRSVWNPGDATDLVEGGAGVDTVEVNGGNGGEVFTVTANGTRVRFDRLNRTPFSLDIGTCEALVLNANGGDDTFSATGNLAALIQITVDGGAGDDTLLGSNGPDVLIGGDGHDFVDGQQGLDTALLGAGDDVFRWDPGDGNDVVEGDDGRDVLEFNGSNGSEIFEFSANGARLRFTRNLGNIVMDLGGIETVDLRALGSNDVVRVNELAGSGLAEANIDFAGTLGGTAGDTLSDQVVLVGTPGADEFDLFAEDGFVIVNRGAAVRVRGREPLDEIIVDGVGGDLVRVHGSDEADTVTVVANGTRARIDATGYSAAVSVGGAVSLAVLAHGGPDSVSCTGNLAAMVPITIDGGSGDDTLLGSNGADLLIGGDGDDFVDGQQGTDLAFLGAGDDVFRWDPGDGNDTVEGQDGLDVLAFNGSNVAEIIDFSANGQRLRLTRNVASIVMDVNGVEEVDLQVLGGADIVTVNSLAGTELTQVNVDLAGTLGGSSGDAQPDSVIVNGSDGVDNVSVAGGITGTLVTGLPVIVNVSIAEAASDRITINALGDDDNVQATGLASGIIGLTLSGGAGDDLLIGSGGGDTLNGDDDDDTIIGAGGSDLAFLGNGNDRFVWNPGDGMDLVEGGEGADVVEVNGGDGAEDFTVTANGTRVRFDRLNPAPFALDVGTCEDLILNARGGNDTLSCTGNLAALIRITADGGAGEDTLRGGNGADLLIGGDDDDFIDGNQGLDLALLGAGDDVFQWDPGDGNDTVEGQNGADALVFNGSNTNEIFEFSRNGQRLRFTRNVGNIVMDVDGVEGFDLRALGGADIVTVNELTGTALADIGVELAGTLGGSTGDAAADAITVNGTQNPDTIHVSASAGVVEVAGLSAAVRIRRSEPAGDTLTVNGLGGVDTITTGPGVTTLIGLFINQ